MGLSNLRVHSAHQPSQAVRFNYRVDNLFSLLSNIIGINDDWRLSLKLKLKPYHNIVCYKVHIGRMVESVAPFPFLSPEQTRSAHCNNKNETRKRKTTLRSQRFFILSDGDLRFIAINQTHSITECLWSVWLAKLYACFMWCARNKAHQQKIPAVISVTIILFHSPLHSGSRENSLRALATIFPNETSTVQFTCMHTRRHFLRHQKTIASEKMRYARVSVCGFSGGLKWHE